MCRSPYDERTATFLASGSRSSSVGGKVAELRLFLQHDLLDLGTARGQVGKANVQAFTDQRGRALEALLVRTWSMFNCWEIL